MAFFRSVCPVLNKSASGPKCNWLLPLKQSSLHRIIIPVTLRCFLEYIRLYVAFTWKKVISYQNTHIHGLIRYTHTHTHTHTHTQAWKHSCRSGWWSLTNTHIECTCTFIQHTFTPTHTTRIATKLYTLADNITSPTTIYSTLGIQYILGYLNTLGPTKQFPVHISEFIRVSEEAVNR